MVIEAEQRPGGLRRARVWLALLAVLGAAAAAFAFTGGTPTRPLDPDSTADGGSRALAQVLAGYGTRLVAGSSVGDARSARRAVAVVLEPDAYSAPQLRALVASARRVVLVAPGTKALRAVSRIEPDADADVDAMPGCAVAGMRAVGRVELPQDARGYTGGTDSCFGGAVVFSGSVVVLGSVQVLQNSHLGDTGVAALDVNLLSADRTAPSVSWLRAGADADGSGATSVWDLFPDAAYRAFWWLIAVAVVLVLWRARRLGPPVTEPLPIVVRSTELVLGHGRLWRRADARDRAASALREATSRRLIARLGLAGDASPQQVGASAAPASGWSGAAVHTVLDGPVPADDAALLQLAHDLDALDTAVRGVGVHGHQAVPHERTHHR